MKNWLFVAALVAATWCFAPSPASAQQPGWSPRVIEFGAQRAQTRATPIIYRDYRPLHFYGNTVRRQYYRGRHG